MWGRKVASTKCQGYWSLEDRAMFIGASEERGRDQGQGWESNQHLGRPGPPLPPPECCDLNSLIALSGPVSVFQPMHTFMSMGVSVPYRDPGDLRLRGWLASEQLVGRGKQS